MDLKTIAGKIQRGDYSGLDEMVRDLQLMCANAKTFNEPGSDIYRVGSEPGSDIYQLGSEWVSDIYRVGSEPGSDIYRVGRGLGHLTGWSRTSTEHTAGWDIYRVGSGLVSDIICYNVVRTRWRCGSW